jgi:hypothetical protein
MSNQDIRLEQTKLYQFECKTKPKKASLHLPVVSDERKNVRTNVEIIPNLLRSLLDTDVFLFIIIFIIIL